MRVCIGAFLVAAGFIGPAFSQNADLRENPQIGDSSKFEMTLNLTGEMTVLQDGKTNAIKIAASAEHQFTEKVLAIAPTPLRPAKSARKYDVAKSSMTIAGSPVVKSLRPTRSLAVAQRHNDVLTAYCTNGALTRDELELISEHFDVLALAGLLPGKETAVGGTWKIPDAIAQAVCLFDGLVSHELTGKFDKLTGDNASITIQGTAKGIELGSQANLTVNATIQFDVKSNRITGVQWKQQDRRDQGPASPALTASSTITIKRTVVEAPKELSDAALESVPAGFEVPAQLCNLQISDAEKRFELVVPRDWVPVGQTERHLVLRLLERGDFVAQATVTNWIKAEAGQHMSAKEFKDSVLGSPGWVAEDVVLEGEIATGQPGRFCYRIAARGKMDEIAVMQTFYLVAGPNGDQAVVTFTTKQAQAGKLGTRDWTVIEGLTFPAKK